MDTRRLLLLLLLVLLPVPAQADRHTWECFGGFSPEKEQSIAARISCGFRVEAVPLATSDTPQAPPPPPSVGHGTGRFRAAATTDPDGPAVVGRQPTKGSLFVVAEVAEYVTGRDSGQELDGWMIGLRRLFFGQKPVEPFGHIMVGRQRPSRSNAIADDAATPWATTFALGGGADIEINPSLHTGVVPVVRLQLDVVKPKGIDVYGRVTFGLSFRFEGSHQ
jgi:hypothetical protein